MTDHVEHFWICKECGWQLQFGDVAMLWLGPMANEIIDFLKEHESEAGHYAWMITHEPWMRVHR